MVAPRPIDVSVVVPCLNEYPTLAGLLRLLRTAASLSDARYEVIVVDGGSTDGTTELVGDFGEARLLHSAPSRAVQMNLGARAARGRALYFVHADARPPLRCIADVAAATSGVPYAVGGYPFAFDSPSALLRLNAYLTGYNVLSVRGGDQGIFLSRALFERLGGYDESHAIMEEYDLLRRAGELGVDYQLLSGGRTLVSDRKYQGRSWARVQLANAEAMVRWRLGHDTLAIRETYLRRLGPRRSPAR